MSEEKKTEKGTWEHGRPDSNRTVDRTVKPKVRAIDHADHWLSRLVRRRFTTPDGKEAEAAEYSVRLFHAGREGYFNLATGSKATAAFKARDVHQYLLAHGWEATNAKFKPKAAPRPDALALENFPATFRATVATLEEPPRSLTAEFYAARLLQVCRAVAIRHVNELTPAHVEEFKAHYRARARKAGRADATLERSLRSTLRNAAACFSADLLAAYAVQGLPLASNPFAGKLGKKGLDIESYQPLARDLLATIWREAALLRDGDPSAPAPKKRGVFVPDFHAANPAAYAVLLLELGCGLRREEADKAEWSWFGNYPDGRPYIKVQATAHFTPKSGQSREVPVEQAVFEELLALREKELARTGRLCPFVVPGLDAIAAADKSATPRTNRYYRCDRAHRALVIWLRTRGVTDRHPCHALRKEFGSFVATTFSLFHAQKLLGHSSPTVTSRHYAALVNVPDLKFANLQRRIGR